jgi:AcrR family transcriptional regulator
VDSQEVVVKVVSSQPLTRRERAERTRIRIIRAAHTAFVQRGYTGTRMTDVAKAAGVAVQTVYLIFHTKPELLAACYDHAVLGDDDPKPPPQQPWYADLLAATSDVQSVSQFVAGNTAICERVAILDETVRAAVHEPEAAEVHQRSQRLRREGYQVLVHHWLKTFGLRPGLTEATAVDLLLMLSGPATYRELVIDDKWGIDAYRTWLHGELLALLAEPPTGSRTGRTRSQPAPKRQTRSRR